MAPARPATFPGIPQDVHLLSFTSLILLEETMACTTHMSRSFGRWQTMAIAAHDYRRASEELHWPIDVSCICLVSNHRTFLLSLVAA